MSGISLGFAELLADGGDHIAHFYHTDSEWRDIASSYLTTGLQRGEKCIYLAPDRRADELRHDLVKSGIDLDAIIASGQLVLNEGARDVNELATSLHGALAEIPARWPLLRWGADMRWALKKFQSNRTLMEWEVHGNTVETLDGLFLCQYDLTSFQGSVVMDALKTHPLCIVSNAIHRNPLYLRPQLFLKELNSRPVSA